MELLYIKIDWPTVELFLYPILSLLIFLALRELVCWYFKINKRIDLLKEQNLLLKKTLEKLGEEIINDDENQ